MLLVWARDVWAHLVMGPLAIYECCRYVWAHLVMGPLVLSMNVTK